MRKENELIERRARAMSNMIIGIVVASAAAIALGIARLLGWL